MTRGNRLIGAAVACVLVGCVMLANASALAQDWPQWRGPNRDAKVSGFTAPDRWPDTLTQKWQVTVGAGDSTPALVGDKLYVFARQGEEEVVLCLNATDGQQVWKYSYAAQAVTGAAARGHTGPRSSPAVADGKVVTLGVGGVVSCVDAAKGTLVWRNDQYTRVPRFFTSMSPLIADGMVIVQLGAEGAGAMVALDLATGTKKWEWTAEGTTYASPALLTVEGVKQVVTLTDKSVVGIALADGKLLWQIPFAVSGMAYNAATPIVDGQTVIYTGQGRGTHAVKIQKQGEAFAATELWANADLGTKFNTPVLKDGFLYGLSDRGNLFCINAANGQTAWTDTTKRGDFGAILDAGSAILLLPNNGELIVIQPNDKAYTELAKIKVGQTTYAHPVLSGNRIFMKDQNALTLWTLP